MKKIIGLVLGLLAFAGTATAQVTPVPPGYSVLGGQTEINAGTSTGRVALPATTVPFGALTLYNKGAVDAFVKQGDVTVTATVGDTQIAAGTAITVWANSNTYLAAITGSSSAKIVVYQATGPIYFAGGGGAGGGGGGGNVMVIGPFGQAVMASSIPVVFASDQSALPVTCALCSTASLQTSGNTSLSTIATNTGSIVTDAHFQATIGTKNAGTAATVSQLAGLVYNSSPLTLTNTQQASLQADSNGYLKVNVAAGSAANSAASATGSAVPANAGYTGLNVGGTLRGQTAVNPTGSIYAAQIDLASYNGTSLGAAGLPVTQAAATATTTTMQSAAVANGNGTVLAVTGMSSAIITLNCSSCSGGTTVNFDGTQDGTNYLPLDAKQLGSISATANSTTTSGITGWQIHTAGLASIRARVSAYSAGTITATGQAVPVDYAPPTINVVGGALDGAAITGALYNTVAGVAQSTITSCTTSTQCFLGMDPTNRALRVQLMPGTLTGSSNDPYEVAASDNHRVIKNGAGTLRSISYTNNSATLAYLRYYNAGTGFNGCNSATGLLYEIGIPANTAIAGDNPSVPANGIAFSTGLSQCVTGGFGNTNTSNAPASAISVNTGFD